MNLIAQTLDDLKAARNLMLEALSRNPKPQAPEAHWLFDAEGR